MLSCVALVSLNGTHIITSLFFHLLLKRAGTLAVIIRPKIEHIGRFFPWGVWMSSYHLIDRLLCAQLWQDRPKAKCWYCAPNFSRNNRGADLCQTGVQGSTDKTNTWPQHRRAKSAANLPRRCKRSKQKRRVVRCRKSAEIQRRFIHVVAGKFDEWLCLRLQPNETDSHACAELYSTVEGFR